MTTRSLALFAAALSVAVTSALTLPTASTAAVIPGASTAMAKRADGYPTDFRLMSFNVLGSSHTAPGGKRASWPSGPKRILKAIEYIDALEIDVVGFQEFQMDQFEAFYAAAGDRFGVYPGGVSRRTVQNSIAWRLDEWGYVAGHTIAIPYFDGVEWQMPVVLLQHLVTGQQAYFANFHNPATNRRHPGNQKWRTEALRRQAALANSLIYETGLPVFFTGDMNEREEYFCGLTSVAPMKAANGGSYRDGVCTPPPYPMPVDWIFGTKRRGALSNYVRDTTAKDARITDHYVIHADVSIRPRVQRRLAE